MEERNIPRHADGIAFPVTVGIVHEDIHAKMSRPDAVDYTMMTI